jgi:tRNA modification GTPase
MPENTLSVAQLTPPGRGAIATLVVSGTNASQVVDRCLATGRVPFRDHAPGRLVVGRIGPGTGEQVVAVRRSSDAVELHCHGGRAAVARIIEVLTREGCAEIDWQSWVDEQHADPIAADAYRALADARTERTAAILADQYRGALRRAIEAIRASVAGRDVAVAGRQVDDLLGRAQQGLHLTAPWQVVLAGEPNVGKSSLINALLGYTRAIVHSAPGTTRDVVTAVTAIDGWPVELADTAGLRETEEAVEQAGVELARRRLSTADVILLVFDASHPWSAAADHLAQRWPQAIRVHNKCDLASLSPLPFDGRGAGGEGESRQAPPSPVPAIATSALTGEGIDTLLAAIATKLVPNPVEPGAAVPFMELHVSLLRSIGDAVAKGDLRTADALAERFGYE